MFEVKSAAPSEARTKSKDAPIDQFVFSDINVQFAVPLQALRPTPFTITALYVLPSEGLSESALHFESAPEFLRERRCKSKK